MEVIFWLCLYTIGFLLTLAFTNSLDFDEEYDWESFLILFIIWPLFISICIIVISICIIFILILSIYSIPEMCRRFKREIKRKYENRFKR